MSQGIVITQARMGSKRLPGKTLMVLKDRTVLGHHLDALVCAIEPSEIWVATSTNPEDDVVEKFCQAEGFNCYRGDTENVASRFLEVLKQSPAEYFIRTNADSPLFDHRVIGELIKRKDSSTEIVSTSFGGGFPSGMNAELVSRETFLRAYPKFSEPGHFEHVTRYFYDNPESFRITKVSSAIPDPKEFKFSLDDAEDLQRIVRVFDRLAKRHSEYTLAEKCEILRQISAG